MRSKPAPKKLTVPDPIYHHSLVTQLINRSMRDGKKAVAQKQVYKAFELLGVQTKQEPLPLFLAAIENIRPQMEVRSRRIGGAAYQVPTPVRADRRDSLAIRWLLMATLARPNSTYPTFAQKLCAEIVEAAANSGAAVKTKLDTHRMAEANKAFAHFRW